jgi:pantoate--beta-alanine ligase
MAGEKEPEKLKSTIRMMIQAESRITIDYIEIVDSHKLASHATIGCTMVILIAVRLGRTRLIDNFLLPWY